jgi:hypothetical protein
MDKKFTYGIRGDISANLIESRIIPFTLSTYTKDRHGTVLNQDGWRLENYRKNPVVGYAHHLSVGLLVDPNPDYIIGKSINLYFTGTGKSKALVADCEFEPAEINPLAEKVFRKVLFGSLRSASVGFIPGPGSYGEGSEEMGGENETFYYAFQDLIEWSIVNIPSNPDAGKRSLASEKGALKYAERIAENLISTHKLKSFLLSDIDALAEIWALGSKDITDPEKAKQLLYERQQRMEQLAEYNAKYKAEETARRIETERKLIEIKEERLKRERAEHLAKREQEKEERINKNPWFLKYE